MTYLTPVANSIEGAREVADGRKNWARKLGPWNLQAGGGGWDIRKEGNDYFVVPAGDPGYQSVGAFVERRCDGKTVTLPR